MPPIARSAPVVGTIALALAACQQPGGTAQRQEGAQPSAAAVPTRDPLAASDAAPGAALAPSFADDQPRPVMQAQVVLDRLGFTPGVIDGKPGLSTRNAISGFQESRGMPVTGELDEATRQALGQWSNIPATRVVTIPADFAAGPFTRIPPRPEDQAKMQVLGYQSLDEKLAERFHTTPATLLALNAPPSPQGGPAPGADAEGPSGGAADPTVSHFRAGQQIRVPNVGADQVDAAAVPDARWRGTLAMLGVGSRQPQAARVVVSKSGGTLKAFDEGGKLIAEFTATMGSSHDPLPLGQWKVTGVAHDPDFSFDPSLLWDVPDSESRQRLPPGPNGPVGVVWIKLSKPHYGIHGTPEPETIGRAQSHGCVRLTNWDAARLAQMVKAGTQVLFEA